MVRGRLFRSLLVFCSLLALLRQCILFVIDYPIKQQASLLSHSTDTLKDCHGSVPPPSTVTDAVITNTKKSYKVTLIDPEGKESTFNCDKDTSLLDAADEADIEDLPYSCRAGACASCTGKLISGSVDQEQQAFLSEKQKQQGYCLTCVSIPTSDVVIKTHCERELLSNKV